MFARVGQLGCFYEADGYGLGQSVSSQSDVTTKIEQLSVSGGTAIGGAAATAAISGSAIGASIATAAIGFGIGAVAVGIVAWLTRKGPAQKVATTKIANELEPLLQQNLAAYLAGPHTVASQTVALGSFQKVWDYMVAACETAALGDPGKRCVTDRQQGACTWKTSPGGWQNGKYVAPGANGSGAACWNWWVGYHDPIANDPTLVSDSASSAVATALQTGQLDLTQLFGSSVGNNAWLWIAGGLLVGALIL